MRVPSKFEPDQPRPLSVDASAPAGRVDGERLQVDAACASRYNDEMNRFMLGFCVFFSACATVQVTPLNAPERPMTPRGPDEVEMFLTKKPARDYDEIYMIRSDAGDSEQALRALRKRAGELGCDAVVITGSADRVVTAPDASGNATVSMREGFLGSCIAFK